MHNMALNLAPYGRWTLRDKATQEETGQGGNGPGSNCCEADSRAAPELLAAAS